MLETVLEAGKIKEYWFSTNQYSSWDCKYSKGGNEYIVEVKVRNNTFNQYPDWILEYKKYQALMEQVKESENKLVAIYVNFFSDGYFSFWVLNNINPENAITKTCRATTAAYNGYTDKQIIPLKIEDAALFGRIDGDSVTKLNPKQNDSN